VELVDSHCHLNFPELLEERNLVLERARERGISYMLCAAVNLEDYPQVLSLAREFPHIFASVGVHPNETEGKDPDCDELSALAADPAVVAIGETGLDFFRSQGDLQWQRKRFIQHIEAAKRSQKPLIIHTRDAATETLQIMQDHDAGTAGGVIHCFTGDWAMARQCLDLGFYISFSGILTFKSARQIQDAASKVPLDRILVETDSPYLAPVPYRGKRNEPAYVYDVAVFLAKLRGVSLATIKKSTTENFFSLFSHAHPHGASRR